MARTHHQTHQAGRHLAVAQALLRGCRAKLVGRSTYIEVNGTKAQTQVAGQGAWQIENFETYLAGTIGAVVLVDVTGERPGFFVVPGDELRNLVRQRHDEFLTRVGGTRPRNPDSKHARIDPSDVQRWKDRWELFE